MAELVEVDRVEIQILVDNATDLLSSAPAIVESELTFTVWRGLAVLSDR